AVDPGNSGDTGLDGHFQGIADAKTIEIVGFYRQSFEFSSWAPGADDEPAAAADDSLHIKGGADRRGDVFNVFRTVKFSVHKKNNSENPGERDEAVEDSFYGFDFSVAAGEAIQNHGQGQRNKEHDAKKDEHEVQIKGRKDLADIRKAERTGKKNQSLV